MGGNGESWLRIRMDVRVLTGARPDPPLLFGLAV
jgi:hypothetical protein